MQSISKDERRLNGDFSARPAGVWPKSALAALPALESAMHCLRTGALRDRILTQTVSRLDFVQVS